MWKGHKRVEVIEHIASLRSWRSGVSGMLGIVPTMGALHEGHLSLIRRARAENGHVGVSIFVNPAQFANTGEVAEYPRTMERDLELLGAEYVDAVFIPHASEIYQPEAVTSIHVAGLSERIEGAARPGHFNGVCLVVCKLLNLFQPDRAYFGQKDFQQLLIIRRMAQDLDIPVDIVPVETVREEDGLALSSRNVFLSSSERLAARAIPDALFAARDAYLRGESSARTLHALVRDRIEASDGIRLEYASVADATTLDDLEVVDRPAVVLLAARCGETRLIDNVLLD